MFIYNQNGLDGCLADSGRVGSRPAKAGMAAKAGYMFGLRPVGIF